MGHTEHRLDTLAEIALLSEEEFERMLPDLAAWFFYAKEAQKSGATVEGFIWRDDGQPGALFAVDLRDASTGEVARVSLSN